jgi:ribonucleotide reductase beta subunit family protein with ferritin-like domain
MKFSLYPIKNNKIWQLYKNQINSFWTPEEIDFSKDYDDFKQLTNEQQHIIKMILAFFSNSDGLVNFNIKNNFLNYFDDEITYTYVFQMFMEQIHNETYSLMIETLIKDDYEKNMLFESLTKIPIINKISNWGLNYTNSNKILQAKILVYICFEGIMFSGAFAIIFWLKFVVCKGKLSGFVKANEFISRDENMHVSFGLEVYEEIKKKVDPIFTLTFKEISGIIIEAVNLTNEFNNEVLRVSEVGMNNKLMKQYTEYVADRIIVQLGYNKLYGSKNPFSFMDTIGMVQKTNFHESRPTEYRKADKVEEFKQLDDF